MADERPDVPNGPSGPNDGPSGPDDSPNGPDNGRDENLHATEQNDGTAVEERLERLLRERAPLLRRRQGVGTPDITFVAHLRARLLSDEMAQPAAVGVGERAAGAPVGAPRHRGTAAGLVAAAAVVLLLILGLVLLAHAPRPAHAPVVAWRPPLPSAADLSRGFPAPVRVSASVARDPTVSLAAPAPGVPYGGHIVLSVVSLPTRLFRLLAFRLAAPVTLASAPQVTRLARRLGLSGAARRVVRGQTAWTVVATGGPPTQRPLHSVAVSTGSGELVYHGGVPLAELRHEVWHANPFAVAAARRWLTQLGWPGTRMPLAAIEHSGLPTGLREIEFGWAEAGPVATDAATLWVTPAGHIIEADLWPPTESARTLVARRVSLAWQEVRAQAVPLALAGVVSTLTAPGTGLLRQVTVTQVLSAGPDQRLYLVPVYRFAGVAHLRGSGRIHPWYALAPADQG